MHPRWTNRYCISACRCLGICYGLHLMTHKLGGKVSPGDKREYGHADVELLRDDCALFKGLSGPLHVWMSHGDEAEAVAARLPACSANLER